MPKPLQTSLGAGPRTTEPDAVPGANARSTSQLKALTELDEPGSDHRAHSGPIELFGEELPKAGLPLRPSAANHNASPAAAELQRLSKTDQRKVQNSDPDLLSDADPTVLTVRTAPEPDVATRVHTHVSAQATFDVTLDVTGTSSPPLDARQRLAWRYEAAFAAYKLLLPTSPTPEARAVMMTAMRSYEKVLRGATRDGSAQSADVLHAQLSEPQIAEADTRMSELEGALLTLDECLTNDQFRTRFGKQHVAPKLLLLYARFLASRNFGIGYERDRFESLAQELLTAKLPSGMVLLTGRKRAAKVLQQLLRALTRPKASSEAQTTQISYMRDSLDRLQSFAGPKQFFDSGFFMDVYGYKISMHERIVNPEFLYLCVAMNVEVHNRLQVWGQSPASVIGKASSSGSQLPALQLQLRAQEEAAQAVFPNFHRPLGAAAASGRAPAKKNRRKRRLLSLSAENIMRFAAAGVLVLAAVAANLFVFGVVQIKPPPEILSTARVQDLSPLLLNGRLSPDGKHFTGLISRPSWTRMSPRERKDAAESLAQAFKARGIDHAEVHAYKTRVLQVDFGTVVFVDGGNSAATP